MIKNNKQIQLKLFYPLVDPDPLAYSEDRISTYTIQAAHFADRNAITIAQSAQCISTSDHMIPYLVCFLKVGKSAMVNDIF